jgi:hypothetical protein
MPWLSVANSRPVDHPSANYISRVPGVTNGCEPGSERDCNCGPRDVLCVPNEAGTVSDGSCSDHAAGRARRFGHRPALAVGHCGPSTDGLMPMKTIASPSRGRSGTRGVRCFRWITKRSGGGAGARRRGSRRVRQEGGPVERHSLAPCALAVSGTKVTG